MKKKDLLELLDNTNENDKPEPEINRYLVIDGLNLFFRNFSVINAVNPQGEHIGGLGGFFRSLGFLIKTIRPTHIYIPFDGPGSSDARKNLISEYKGDRNQRRMTNWDVFEDLDDEDDSKVNQITRIIQYLKYLPIKTTSLPRVEADDVIAYLSTELTTNNNDKVFIVSNDRDYLQIINDQVTVYLPTLKKFVTPKVMREEYKMSPKNFILYKILMGDQSDKISKIKGLGKGKLYKLFPEIMERNLTLDDLLDICEKKLGEHIIYARVLHDIPLLETNYKVMDLSIPMMGEGEKEEVRKLIKSKLPELNSEVFLKLHTNDNLGNLIRNPKNWLQDNFGNLK